MASATAVGASAPATTPIRRRGVAIDGQVAIGLVVLGLMVAAAIILPLFVEPQIVTLGTPDQSPSLAHPMGLGTHSQDIYSEWVYAARPSLTIGLLGGLGSTALSILIGVTAGYIGGWADDVLSFLTRVLLLVPPIPALFVAAFGLSVQGVGPLVLLLTLMTWAYGADLLRSQTVALRRREFVLAAMATGEGPLHVMIHEVLPHLRGIALFVLVNAALFALQAEFALEFLDGSRGGGYYVLADANALGGGWGIMLSNAFYDGDFFAGVWWTWLFPGLGIMVTTAALALISAGLAGRESA